MPKHIILCFGTKGTIQIRRLFLGWVLLIWQLCKVTGIVRAKCAVNGVKRIDPVAFCNAINEHFCSA